MDLRGHRLLAGLGGAVVAGPLVVGEAGLAAGAENRASSKAAARTAPPPGSRPAAKIRWLTPGQPG